ncbi:transglutaminase-like cysteine peptidase [Roseobacter weihaiensis]|uniref:transglutaminase-like cysteine peptidase n=1 Tax=Roseobacter weihaiensis TaxID=2763262 RepID=UPI001D09E85E|nr:transglutaminase-like cysteine peptidase [Roseobacter sp. H9]
MSSGKKSTGKQDAQVGKSAGRPNWLAGLWSWASFCRAGVFRMLAVGMCASLLTVPSASAAGAQGAHLVAKRSVTAPAGFDGICARYTWVCTASGKTQLSPGATFDLATKVNRQVNRQVREIEDQRQYGKEEHWALPTRYGGDCEDLVLLKKKMLVERGVKSENLLIATVLDKRLNSHAVLVLRTTTGDVILDNLTNRILPWHETGYTFLKVQNPKVLSKWHAILAGGVINDRPTASR